MDPLLKMWMYHQWLGDHRDEAELAKNHAYLLGSFTNPEAVKQMTEGMTHESSDEDFEKSLQMVKDANRQKPVAQSTSTSPLPTKKKKRKHIVSQPSPTK
jgi:hypothetical protein